jgi:hypothetical protein
MSHSRNEIPKKFTNRKLWRLEYQENGYKRVRHFASEKAAKSFIENLPRSGETNLIRIERD